MRSAVVSASTARAKNTETTASKTSYRAMDGGLKAIAMAQKTNTASPMRANVSQKGSVNSTGMMTQSIERKDPGAVDVPGASMAMMPAKSTTS